MSDHGAQLTKKASNVEGLAFGEEEKPEYPEKNPRTT
jgi:hypothetical protein